MKGCLAFVLVLASACSGDSLSLYVERQPASLTAATDEGWVAGSALAIAEPGSFTFPQPVSIRVMLIDPDAVPADDETRVEPELVSTAKATVYGEGAGTITSNITCQPTFCEAEVTLASTGLAVLQLTAQNADGEESDCFYYGVYEDADPAAAGAALRADAEAAQTDCLNDLLD